MPDTTSKAELIKIILEDEDAYKLEEEEMMHLLVHRKVSKDASSLQNEKMTFGAKMADGIAQFAGSWTFILIFLSCLVFWIILNSLILTKAFDVYPYILLNLLLSCIAAIQAPVIMMSQNRQETKDRLRSQNDYRTNLKAELIIEDLHLKLDQILLNQDQILQRLDSVENPPIKQE